MQGRVYDPAIGRFLSVNPVVRDVSMPWSWNGPDWISDRYKINDVGPLMCLSNVGDKGSEASLLRESEVPPWFTCGQFRTSELIGACAKPAEFERLRHIR
jgi:hypothetical protein